MKKSFPNCLGCVTLSSKDTGDREQRDLEEVKNVFFLFSYRNMSGISFFSPFPLRAINLEEKCSHCSVFTSFTSGLTPVFV